MIYHTNPDKLRRYDRTDYRTASFWIQRRRCASGARCWPWWCRWCAASWAIWPWQAGTPSCAWSLPWPRGRCPAWFCFPLPFSAGKTTSSPARGMAICRYDDRLDLQPKRLIYSYRDRRKGRYGPRYESSVPYSLLDRILYFPDRNFLVLWCGGVDTVYDASGGCPCSIPTTGRASEKSSAATTGCSCPWSTTTTNAVLRELESLSGTPVERYPGNEIAVPEDKTAGKSADCVKNTAQGVKFFANRLRRPAPDLL